MYNDTRGVQKVSRMILKNAVNFIDILWLITTIYHYNIAQYWLQLIIICFLN